MMNKALPERENKNANKIGCKKYSVNGPTYFVQGVVVRYPPDKSHSEG